MGASPFRSGIAGLCHGAGLQNPNMDAVLPAQYHPATGTQQFSKKGQPVVSWWQQFHDPRLNALIHRLFTSSIVLEQARERVIEAGARQGIVTADKRLQLSAALGYTHGESGDGSVSLQGIRPGQTMDLFSTGVVAGWELDLWGRTDRLLEAAEQDIRVSHADYHGMLVSLAAETALAYVDARTLDARMEMVTQNIDLQQKSLALARARFEAGNGTELAVVRAARLVQSSLARLPELQSARTRAVNRINVLLGQPPGTEVPGPGTLPEVPALIGLGLPADLVTRRPDIRRALAAHHAAVARTGAARAEQYPTLSLSGNLTLSSDTLGNTLHKDAFIYTLGPGLNFPLLTGGRIQSTIAVRRSQSEQARLAMEQLILQALAEVENSAEGVVRTQEQVDRLVQAEKLSVKSVHLAQELYRAGLADFSQVLDSEKELIAVQESLLLARQQSLVQVVQLYRALGGGWEQAPPAISGEKDDSKKNKTNSLLPGNPI